MTTLITNTTDYFQKAVVFGFLDPCYHDYKAPPTDDEHDILYIPPMDGINIDCFYNLYEEVSRTTVIKNILKNPMKVKSVDFHSNKDKNSFWILRKDGDKITENLVRLTGRLTGAKYLKGTVNEVLDINTCLVFNLLPHEVIEINLNYDNWNFDREL